MEIKQASPVDEAAVCRLWKILLEYYGKEAGPRVLRRSFRYAVRRPRRVRIFVALIDGEAVGTASLHLGHYSTWFDHWYGHIEDVIVDPRFRRRGICSGLVRHVIEIARREGLARLELNTLSGNSGARRLYERLGFKTDSVVYELPLKT